MRKYLPVALPIVALVTALTVVVYTNNPNYSDKLATAKILIDDGEVATDAYRALRWTACFPDENFFKHAAEKGVDRKKIEELCSKDVVEMVSIARRRR